MSAYDEGVKVLRIAADMGNTPSQAVLDELAFRASRIQALHELNSELNAQLRDARLQLARCPEGWNALFMDRPTAPEYGDADPLEHLTHAND